MKKELNEIMDKYTKGEATLEETNEELQECGYQLHLDLEKNVLTEEEKRATVVGYYPDQASGWGLLDTGTGTLDKVRVKDGALLDCDCGDSYALVFLAGRMYRVTGTKLVEI